jgi:hypothetical protein
LKAKGAWGWLLWAGHGRMGKILSSIIAVIQGELFKLLQCEFLTFRHVSYDNY